MMNFAEELSWFNKAALNINAILPEPSRTDSPFGTVYRFQESKQEFVVALKAFRYVSGLNASALLLDAGFVQELGVLKRTLDELLDDIHFVTRAILEQNFTELHHRYLDAFWQEEPCFDEYRSRQRNRDQVPRRNIRAHLANSHAFRQTTENETVAPKYTNMIFSGFVHAGSPQVMDMYNPDRRLFEVAGCTHFTMLSDFSDSLENYFFRGFSAIVLTAKALGDEMLSRDAFERQERYKPDFT